MRPELFHCNFFLYLSVSDNFSASNLSKVGDVAKHRQTSYKLDRILLMGPKEPWQNSIPFFGAEAFCTSKNDEINDLKNENELNNEDASKNLTTSKVTQSPNYCDPFFTLVTLILTKGHIFCLCDLFCGHNWH